MFVIPVYLDSTGTVTWGKERITDAQLRTYMRQVSEFDPVPQVILDVSNSTPCSRVRRVRAIMNSAPMCNVEYPACSEGQNWKNWPESSEF